MHPYLRLLRGAANVYTRNSENRNYWQSYIQPLLSLELNFGTSCFELGLKFFDLEFELEVVEKGLNLINLSFNLPHVSLALT